MRRYGLAILLAACGSDPVSQPADTVQPPADVDSGDVAPGDVDPGDVAPGDVAPSDVAPGDVDPGDVAPGDIDPGDVDPGDIDPGDVDPGDVTAPTWPETLGGSRPARVRAPTGYAGEPLPALILLGGYDYFARDLDDWLELSRVVDSRRFLLVLPDGLVDRDGSPYWNATDTCCDFYGRGVDDVAYLTGLFDELEAAYAVSSIALVGHSAGGFMAYRMACEVPSRLGAVVSIAGSGFLDPADCAVTDVPLPILQVHGADDDIMPFDGDSDAPGALEMLARWAETNGCSARSWTLSPLTPALAAGGSTQVGTYGDRCAEDVRLWLLNGSDHYPSFRSAFVPALLEWLGLP